MAFQREAVSESEIAAFSTLRIFMAVVAFVSFIVFLAVSKSLFEKVDAEEIMVVQSPVKGTLSWHVVPGMKWQGMGKVNIYQKRSIYEFQTKVRFNDGGHATMHGSIQYEMPLDVESLTALHIRFGSQEAIQKQLVETVATKSIYMTGPLMSSRESYAEKRNYLIHFVEDQIENGVYKTYQRDTRVKDPITGQDKNMTLVEVAMKNGQPERQEAPVLTAFGIKPFNFSISELTYEEDVDKQIKQQQQIAMDVQTAIADAKKAEQRAITVAEQGKADAAKAKWEQEVLKAKAVTEAEQKLEVAELAAQTAEQYKLEQVLRAEADSAYKRQVMTADGALAQKLEALVKINELYADAIKEHNGPWVPNVVMGNHGGVSSSPGGAALPLIDLLTARTAQQLGIDLSVTGAEQTKSGK